MQSYMRGSDFILEFRWELYGVLSRCSLVIESGLGNSNELIKC